MHYSDIQAAPQILSLKTQFEEVQEEFTPHLETAFNTAYSRAGVGVDREVLIQEVATALYRALSICVLRKKQEAHEPPKTNLGFFRALIHILFKKKAA